VPSESTEQQYASPQKEAPANEAGPAIIVALVGDLAEYLPKRAGHADRFGKR